MLCIMYNLHSNLNTWNSLIEFDSLTYGNRILLVFGNIKKNDFFFSDGTINLYLWDGGVVSEKKRNAWERRKKEN